MSIFISKNFMFSNSQESTQCIFQISTLVRVIVHSATTEQLTEFNSSLATATSSTSSPSCSLSQSDSSRCCFCISLKIHLMFRKAVKEGREEMFYLTMHSTHFIYGYMEGRKEMIYLTTHSTHFIYSYME